MLPVLPLHASVGAAGLSTCAQGVVYTQTWEVMRYKNFVTVLKKILSLLFLARFQHRYLKFHLLTCDFSLNAYMGNYR